MKKWLLQLTVWGLVILLLIIAMRDVEPRIIIPLLQQLHWWQITVLLASNMLVIIFFGWRWYVILRVMQPTTNVWRLCLHRLGGFGVSYFTPGPQVGGEPVQLGLLHQDGVPTAIGLASIGIDKLVEISINLLFILFGLIVIVNANIPLTNRYWGVGISVIGLGVPLALLGAMWHGVTPLSNGLRAIQLTQRFPRLKHLVQVIEHSEANMVTFLQTHPRTTLSAFGISCISWVGLLVSYWLMAYFIGIQLMPMELISLLMAQQIAFLLPLPGGLGALEASQTFMFGLLGYDPSIGITLSLLMRVRDVTFGLLGLGWVALAWKQPD